jgi:Tfp pilus assembly protein PilO
MTSASYELAALGSLSIEFWHLLAVVVLCFLLAVVTYWLVHSNRILTRCIEQMLEEDKKKREEQEKVKTSIQCIEADIINLRFSMLQDFRRSADTIRKMDLEAREYLKSLGNEVVSRMEEKGLPKEQTQIESQHKIDGKKSLKKA